MKTILLLAIIAASTPTQTPEPNASTGAVIGATVGAMKLASLSAAGPFATIGTTLAMINLFKLIK